ncbi:hypothetical protein PGB90_003739 [Kerria lacca]
MHLLVTFLILIYVYFFLMSFLFELRKFLRNSHVCSLTWYTEIVNPFYSLRTIIWA